MAADPHDAVTDMLVEHYRTLLGEHDDWTAFREQQVADGRILALLRPARAYGMLPVSSLPNDDPPLARPGRTGASSPQVSTERAPSSRGARTGAQGREIVIPHAGCYLASASTPPHTREVTGSIPVLPIPKAPLAYCDLAPPCVHRSAGRRASEDGAGRCGARYETRPLGS